MKNLLDNPFMNFMTKVFDLCLLNIMTFICCLPIVTAGAAMTALYAVMLKMARNEEGTITTSFRKEFRENLKGSFAGWMTLLALILLFLINLNFWTADNHGSRSFFWGATLVFLGVLLAVTNWYFAIRAKFEESSMESVKRAVKFAVCFLPATLVMGGATLAFLWFLTKHAELVILLPLGLWCLLEYPKALYIRMVYDRLFKKDKASKNEDNCIVTSS